MEGHKDLTISNGEAHGLRVSDGQLQVYDGAAWLRMMMIPGINWIARQSAADNYWYGVTYGNGMFVAVAYSGNGNRVMTSGAWD